ncbi:sulfite efflux pump SSU1 [Phanerochaete sordida]|uniref:Sulfite efflux pump SSU1 n=1 Tax=Phanerochaete sordida TaxID=48140 RepID=A0A9P3GH91_9APHY|nr:sulfite efflux pump SSU1 [Phanerochaete sordida]
MDKSGENHPRTGKPCDFAPPKTLKDCVRHFTPAWFAVIMGTGAVDILWHNYPYLNDTRTFKTITLIIFFLNLTLFVIFTGLTISRYVLFPDIWGIMIRHPVQSLYIGTFPMGATTLINIGVGEIYQQYGFGHRGFLYALWAFWWADIVLSLVCVFAVVHVMKTRQDHALSRMTAIWLLPIVTVIVASSTGGILAPALMPFSRYDALITLTVSAFLVSVGLVLALMVLTTYFLRLIIYGVPQGASVISTFIPLGPMAQGGYSILLLGQGFRSVLPLANSSQVLSDSHTGDIINVICVVAAFVLWALATMWLLYAFLAVQEVLRQGLFPFKLPVWGLIFPNGVYANLSIQLSRELDITSIRVWGAIYALLTLIVWAAVFLKTVSMLRKGQIFESPCIEEIDMGRGVSSASAGKTQRDLTDDAEAGNGVAGRNTAAQWSGTTVSTITASQTL